MDIVNLTRPSASDLELSLVIRMAVRNTPRGRVGFRAGFRCYFFKIAVLVLFVGNLVLIDQICPYFSLFPLWGMWFFEYRE